MRKSTCYGENMTVINLYAPNSIAWIAIKQATGNSRGKLTETPTAGDFISFLSSQVDQCQVDQKNK